MNDQPKRLSTIGDQKEKKNFEGDMVKLSELVGKEFLILDFIPELIHEKNGPYTLAQIELEGVKAVTAIGNKYMRALMINEKDNLPFIVKVGYDIPGRYYFFE